MGVGLCPALKEQDAQQLSELWLGLVDNCLNCDLRD